MHGETRLLVTRDQFREGLIQIVAASSIRMTVRQIFYLATVQGLVPKSERGYAAVQQQLVRLRREGLVDYSAIVDNTRRRIHTGGWDSPRGYLDHVSRGYSANLWLDQPRRVVLFLEKDALSGLVRQVTDVWQVPLYVSRGYGSVTYLREAALDLDQDLPTTILMLGDYDPSGWDARLSLIEEVAHHHGGGLLDFVHVALTKTQVLRWGIPTRPTKDSDSRSYSVDWPGGESAELDAIPPEFLQERITGAITKRVDHDLWKEAQIKEKRDRQRIRQAMSRLQIGNVIKSPR